MGLAEYLARIGFDREPKADRETLARVQRRHLLSIPYENLDVQLGRRVITDPAAAFEKLVTRRRGGWCYEMNGLLGWALAEIGFAVTRLASGVMRSVSGDEAIGSHLVLRVDLNGESFLADAGLGDGPLEPFPIADGPWATAEASYRLERLEGGWWRLHNRVGGRPPDFDFRPDLIDEALLSRKCVLLQTDPSSMFVQNLICQRIVDGGHVQLLGRVLRRFTGEGAIERVLASADELTDVLAADFGIDEPAAAGLWPRICARHAELFGADGSARP
jgi:N-hydroxyarylamine O-acetyltransferase